MVQRSVLLSSAHAHCTTGVCHAINSNLCILLLATYPMIVTSNILICLNTYLCNNNQTSGSELYKSHGIYKK